MRLTCVATYGYARVSTSRQAESRLGLDAQRAAMLAFDPAVLISEESASAGEGKDRPILASLLGVLAAGDSLVVSKIDRLARSVVDFGQILSRAQRQGWALVILDLQLDTSSPVGKMTANILASVAEFERDMIRTRTKESAAISRARGKRLGKPSALDPAIVTLIHDSRRDGLSWADLAVRLNALDLTTPTGRAWTRESVRSASQVGDTAEATRRRG